MEQHLLRIKLPSGQTLYPSDFRIVVAAQDKLSPALFAREDDGQTVQYPGVRFIGGAGWLGVLADAAHADVLNRHTGDVIMAASKLIKAPCPVEFETNEFDLIPKHYLCHYRISRMAIKRRHASAKTCEINDLVTQRVLSSIERTCFHYGIDCPERESLNLIGMDVQRSIGMRLDTDKGATKEFVSLVDATFSIHAKLTGYWFAGNLTSRGHGRITRQVDAGWAKEGV